MRFWVLSHLQRSPGNRLILEAASRAGHSALLVDPTSLCLRIQGGLAEHELSLFDAEGPCEMPELALTRMGSSAPPDAFDALHQLEAAGVETINNAAALLRARDKVLSFQAMAGAGVPLPATAVVGKDAPQLELLLEGLGPAPWIVKLPQSTQGLGVARVDSLASLRTVIDMLRSLDQRVLIQHYIREASGIDIRVLVVGGEAVAAMRRQATGDEVRSNLHRGGSAEELTLTPLLAETAVRAAEAVGLGIAGVDLLPSDEGPLVAEVNGSPGLAGLEAATGRDLAGAVVSYLARRLEATTS